MKQKPRYRSPSISRDVEVGLDDFSDDELRKEYAHRFSGDVIGGQEVFEIEETVPVSTQRLRDIHRKLVLGRHSEAIRELDDFVRDVFGTAL